MAGVFDVVATDHAEVKQMLTDLEAGPTAAAGASNHELEQRKNMVESS